MNRFSRQKALAGILFVTPALVLLTLFMFIPAISAFLLSFYKWSALGNKVWVGFWNFTKMQNDRIFWRALGNTFKYVAIIVPAQFVLSLSLALLLKRTSFLVNLTRTSTYLPLVTSSAVVGLLWKYIYDPTWGVFNYLLELIGLQPLGFLSDPKQSLYSVAGVIVWKSIGFYMIIFLAGLQDIPSELYEAAEIDGASPFQALWRITMPLLKYTSFFIVTLQIINAFRIFTEIHMMTRGGPVNSSISLVYYIYNSGFQLFEMGYAAAVALVLFIIVFVVTALQMTLFRSAY